MAYANANTASFEMVDEEVRDDPGIYPPEEVKARLVTADVMPPKVQRLKVV